jgi:hypothetical protein
VTDNRVETDLKECAVAVDGSAIWHNGIRYTPDPTDAEKAALRNQPIFACIAGTVREAEGVDTST